MGVVECDGKPLSNVVVSDGYEVTTTDDNGCYYINSKKDNGYVFVTSPSGYEYQVTNYYKPTFWANLNTDNETIERHDFRLVKKDNTQHIMYCVSDIQLSNRWNDIEQFKQKSLPFIRKTLKKFKGKPVYSMNTGDLAYDRYWYSDKFTIESFSTLMEEVRWPMQMFSCMGNHDHDAATICDNNTHFNAERRYRAVMGPTYYSFNIGKIHYIMIDNIYYLNEPYAKGKINPHQGTSGRVNYYHYISQEQIDWIKKDLKHVDKSTPLVIGMHDPMFKYAGLSTTKYRNNFKYQENFDDFISTLKGYQVHIISGHSHIQRTTYVDSLNLIDHNVSAVAGNLWVTGGLGYELQAFDGSPAGFDVLSVDGTSLKWKYYPVSCGEKVQCRMWDMNAVKKYCNEDPAYLKLMQHYPKCYDFRKEKDNVVYLHVWAWDPTWKVEVFEDGKPIVAKRKMLSNPQYALTYYAQRYFRQKQYPARSLKFPRVATMFYIQCKDEKSTIKVVLTDTFGEKYSQTLKRPSTYRIPK
ncbi:MAG: calcineurin-like phosphoesterase C-terminal domain-containing protein [Alistipes sp.]|nr:calcineurin-like phosphoesterase C-terminal domain-containing protein [Candidatus Alistipes equi]